MKNIFVEGCQQHTAPFNFRPARFMQQIFQIWEMNTIVDLKGVSGLYSGSILISVVVFSWVDGPQRPDRPTVFSFIYVRLGLR